MTFLVTGDLIGGAGALWVSLLIDLMSKGTLLLAAAWLLRRVLGTVQPARRSLIWTCLFLVLMVVPLVTVILFQYGEQRERTPFGFLPNPVVTLVQGQADAPVLGNGSEDASVASVPIMGTTKSGPTELRRWNFLVYLWLAGFIFLAGRALMRTVLGAVAARSQSSQASSATVAVAKDVARQLGVSNPFTVVISRTARVPFLAGFLGARLVLPATMDTWSGERLRPVFLHELAHLKRHDTSRLILGELVCALYWFNPLVWQSAAKARLDQELSCDDTVCQHGIQGTEYARLLLQFASGSGLEARHHEAPGFARHLGLEVRLHHVLAIPGREKGWAKIRPWLVALPIGLVMVGTVTLTSAVLVEQTAVINPAPVVAEVESQPTPYKASSVQAAIHDLAAAGNVAQIATLLDHDASQIDQQNEQGMTPLAVAAWNGHLELVADLLARGAQPDLKNHNGLTALFCAVDRGRVDLARLLIQNGADVLTHGYDGRSLVHMAARSGDAWVLNQAIAQGADVSAPDRSGVRPLDLAAWGRHETAIRSLTKLGAKRSDLPNPHVKLDKNRESKHLHVS